MEDYTIEERIRWRDKKGRFAKVPEELETDASNKRKESLENER